MTDVERKQLIESIVVMHAQLNKTYDNTKIINELQKKEDLQLALIFKKYTKKMKSLEIKRPRNSFISQILFDKIEHAIEKAKESKVHLTYQKDEEEMSLMQILSAWRFSDFCSKTPFIDFPFFNSKKIQSTPSEKLLDIFALCSHYQIAKLKSIKKSHEKLGLDISIVDEEIKLMVRQVKKYFYHTGDYWELLRRHPLVEHWSSKSIEEIYEDLNKMLKEFIFKPDSVILQDTGRMLKQH
jgi:hypothetical protein